MQGCRSTVALAGFLLLVPDFVGVLRFGHIVEVAVVVHHPAAVHAEGVLVSVAFALLAPLHLVAAAHTDARSCIEVDAHRDQIVLDDKRQRVAALQALDLRRAEAHLFRQHLQIASDDRREYGHDLIRAGIHLHECFAAASVGFSGEERLLLSSAP